VSTETWSQSYDRELQRQRCKNLRRQRCKNLRRQRCKKLRRQRCKNLRRQRCKNLRRQRCKNLRRHVLRFDEAFFLLLWTNAIVVNSIVLGLAPSREQLQVLCIAFSKRKV
jgi:hypothetical protein